MELTVAELIEMLSAFKGDLKVQLDAEGAIYDQMHLDRVGNKLVIFSEGESTF